MVPDDSDDFGLEYLHLFKLPPGCTKEQGNVILDSVMKAITEADDWNWDDANALLCEGYGWEEVTWVVSDNAY